jgi:hypothetical protein
MSMKRAGNAGPFLLRGATRIFGDTAQLLATISPAVVKID